MSPNRPDRPIYGPQTYIQALVETLQKSLRPTNPRRMYDTLNGSQGPKTPFPPEPVLDLSDLEPAPQMCIHFEDSWRGEGRQIPLFPNLEAEARRRTHEIAMDRYEIAGMVAALLATKPTGGTQLRRQH